MNSKAQREESMQKAEDALQAADVKELHSLFLAARRDHEELFKTFDTVVSHYIGTSKEPRMQSSDAISAMRDVALASIQLAASIANK